MKKPVIILFFICCVYAFFGQTEVESVDMVLVQGGTFTMGGEISAFDLTELKKDIVVLGLTEDNFIYKLFSDQDAKPVHQVTVNSFYISKFEVNQRLWDEVIGQDYNSSYENDPDFPVYNLSWYAAVYFCNMLSENDGLESVYSIYTDKLDPDNKDIIDKKKFLVIADFTKNGYRLPTEAEWEFAARGGNKNNSYIYAGSSRIDDVAWYNFTSKTSIEKAGLKKPNNLGIYDMSGNVCNRQISPTLRANIKSVKIDLDGGRNGKIQQRTTKRAARTKENKQLVGDCIL